VNLLGVDDEMGVQHCFLQSKLLQVAWGNEFMHGLI
jgi:hypothetical protein